MNKVCRKLKAPHSKDYLRNKRTIIGALEQFDDFGRMPDGRSRHTLFERGSYHLLCSEFRELIDFYRIYEKKRGKKESTYGVKHSIQHLFYIRCSNGVPSVWMQ